MAHIDLFEENFLIQAVSAFTNLGYLVHLVVRSDDAE